ncbi:M15 family metallopeptidase [Albimonas pacifica]|uniref:D-alanyl-D-alanine carboxypeptidase n=1 Tax=Albimonas pacifica TaxID=1114924 RepID=A0A1I3BLU6_9RHOB|nr:M15 family metallopeptidase [Albimonas pacifica]SFH62899.1 D-alanyl-D-alanine carboxypeptidase [Albimonas pacifica]
MRLLPSALIALSIASTPVIWSLSQVRWPAPAPGLPAGAESRLAALETEAAGLRRALEDLRGRVDGLDAGRSAALPPRRELSEGDAPASDALIDAFAQVVLIADRRSANAGLTAATPAFLEEIAGLPRPDLNDDCQAATNPRLTDLLETADVGPIRARLLRPALVSLRQVFANVQVFEPELYRRITSAGSLCVRRIRGSDDSASAHAYGLAVDLNIDGVLDELADGRTQLGLILLADFFRKEGWIWGAGFGREDSMHFEVSREKLEQWRRLGLI